MEKKNLDIETKATVDNGLMVPVEDNVGFVADLTTRSASYISFQVKDDKDKAKLFNLMNSPDERVASHINEVIEIQDIYVETVDCVNEKTGEITTCPRIVLLDKNGVSYTAVSVGLFSALQKLIRVYGEPTWNPPLALKVKQEKTRNGNSVLTLKF